MPIRRILALTLAALALGMASACSTQRDIDDELEAPRNTGPARLEVENQNFADMTIYVIRSGQRFRLGTVTGHSTQTFDIPAAYVAGGGNLQFMADPIGSSQTPVSEVIYVAPGELIELTIPPGVS